MRRKKKPKQVYSNPEKKNCWKQTKFVLCEADSKKPGIQVVFMLQLFFQNHYADGQILKGNGYGLFFPFLHINVVVFAQKRKKCRNTIFSLWCKNFHIFMSQRHKPVFYFSVIHLSTLKHFSSSCIVTVSFASLPSEVGWGFRGCDIKRKLSRQCLRIPFRTSSFFHYLFKNKGITLNFLVIRFKEDHFSLLHPCPWGCSKKERTGSFSSSHQKNWETEGVTVFPGSKKKRKR